MVRNRPTPTCCEFDTALFDRQREEEKHRKREDKDNARYEKKHHKREEQELCEARERDRQAQYQQNQYQRDQYRAGAERLSPCSAPNILPNNASPHQGDGQLPGSRQASPISPYQSGGVLPGTKPVSPYPYGGNLPGTTYHSDPNYRSTDNEAEKKAVDLGIRGKAAEYHSRKSAGYQPAPGGDYPSGILEDRYTATTAVPSHNPYHSIIPLQPQTATRGGPSPSPFSLSNYQPPPQPQSGQAVPPPPECFSRLVNTANSYTQFGTSKIQDMDDLVRRRPEMPEILITHDVYREDWARFIQDLSNVWSKSTEHGNCPFERSLKAADQVERWNANFFNIRRAELILCQGREHRSGKRVGEIDTDLPGFGITADDISDFSEEDHGRQDSRTKARREINEQKWKRKEKEAMKRVSRLERKYAIYLSYR